jgi:hypothetical protein
MMWMICLHTLISAIKVVITAAMFFPREGIGFWTMVRQGWLRWDPISPTHEVCTICLVMWRNGVAMLRYVVVSYLSVGETCRIAYRRKLGDRDKNHFVGCRLVIQKIHEAKPEKK